MKIHFSQLFWGLLLVILDFSINGFDLLADGVGYLIAAAGCGGLAMLSPKFQAARTLAFVLAALWLIGFAMRGDLAVLHGAVTTIVNCMFMWQLLGGIADFAIARERPDLVERAEFRRIAYVFVMACSSGLTLMLSGARSGGTLVVALVIAMLVLLAMILHLIHRTSTELAD